MPGSQDSNTVRRGTIGPRKRPSEVWLGLTYFRFCRRRASRWLKFEDRRQWARKGRHGWPLGSDDDGQVANNLERCRRIPAHWVSAGVWVHLLCFHHRRGWCHGIRVCAGEADRGVSAGEDGVRIWNRFAQWLSAGAPQFSSPTDGLRDVAKLSRLRFLLQISLN